MKLAFKSSKLTYNSTEGEGIMTDLDRYNKVVQTANRLLRGDESIDAKVLLEEAKGLRDEVESSARLAVLNDRIAKIEEKIDAAA